MRRKKEKGMARTFAVRTIPWWSENPRSPVAEAEKYVF